MEENAMSQLSLEGREVHKDARELGNALEKFINKYGDKINGWIIYKNKNSNWVIYPAINWALLEGRENG